MATPVVALYLFVREKIGDAGPRVCYAWDAGIFARIVVGACSNHRLQFRSVDPLKVHAELQRVVADDLGQVVEKFQDMFIFQRRIIVWRAETVDPRRRYVDQSALIRGKRNSAQPQSVSDTLVLELNCFSVKFP